MTSASRAAAPADWKKPDLPAMSACACVKNKACWAAVLEAYALNAGMVRMDMDASLPNRFFPDSQVTVFAENDKDGNFISVVCGSERRACGDKRDELQKRAIYASFLAALPVEAKGGALFDPTTWEITARGEKTVAEARRCKPGLLGQLVGSFRGI